MRDAQLGVAGVPHRADDSKLASVVAATMREESVVIAARAGIGDGDIVHPRLGGLLGDKDTQIDRRWALDALFGQPQVDLGRHLVARTADGRSAVHAQLTGGEPQRAKMSDGTLYDGELGASPTGVNDSGCSALVGDENGDAVGEGDGHGGSALGCEMPVGVVRAQPPFPPLTVHDYAITVDLVRTR